MNGPRPPTLDSALGEEAHPASVDCQPREQVRVVRVDIQILSIPRDGVCGSIPRLAEVLEPLVRSAIWFGPFLRPSSAQLRCVVLHPVIEAFPADRHLYDLPIAQEGQRAASCPRPLPVQGQALEKVVVLLDDDLGSNPHRHHSASRLPQERRITLLLEPRSGARHLSNRHSCRIGDGGQESVSGEALCGVVVSVSNHDGDYREDRFGARVPGEASALEPDLNRLLRPYEHGISPLSRAVGWDGFEVRVKSDLVSPGPRVPVIPPRSVRFQIPPPQGVAKVRALLAEAPSVKPPIPHVAGEPTCRRNEPLFLH